MMNSINEIKNSLEGINSRITEAEERISDLEEKTVEITTAEQNKEKRMKRIEDKLRDLCDNIKRTNIQIIGVPEEEEKGTEKIFEEIIVENFPNMEKEIVMIGKNLQPRLLYPARISFRFDREIKTFTDKQKLREFSTTKPALQQMLKELL